MSNMLPLGKLLIALIVGGFLIEFVLIFVYDACRDAMGTTSGIGIGNIYVDAVILLCTHVPAWAIFISASFRYWMHTQKRSVF